MKLNEAGQGGMLAPTDCRNRPDIRLCFGEKKIIFSCNTDYRALEEGDLDMAAAKKEYLENKQREFRSFFLEGFTTNSSVVWIGRSSRTKRRATGGHQDGLCLQNHPWLERMTGELQETFGKRISRNLLKYFKPQEWTGFHTPTPVDEFFLVFEVVKKAERKSSKSEIGSEVRVR